MEKDAIMNVLLSKKESANHFITVVSGLPRSGTSMMMKILNAGDMPVLINDFRESDEDNPKGYYEFERVKKLEHENSWLQIARGKAVKVVSPLIYHLNLEQKFRYKIIFMLRDLNEILASQRKMAGRLHPGKDKIKDNILKHNYSVHLEKVRKWQDEKENIDVMYVNYKDVIADPAPVAEGIRNFLAINLNIQKMVKVIDKSLYRQRVEKHEVNDCTNRSEDKTEDEAIMERLKNLGYV